MKNHKTVIKLREEGRKYKEICEVTGYAKSTVSYILRHIENNHEIESENKRNSLTDERKKVMREKADEYYSKLRKDSYNEWKSKMSKIDIKLLSYIAGLYDGEGYHNPKDFRFCNSDIKIIKSFMYFLHEMNLSESDYSLTLRLPYSLEYKLNSCKVHWSKIGKFKVEVYDNRKQNVSKHKEDYFGVMYIRVKNPLMLKEALDEYSFSMNESLLSR